MGSFSNSGGGGGTNEDEEERTDEDITEYSDSASSPDSVEEDDDDSTGAAIVAGAAAAAGTAAASGSGTGSAGATGGAATGGGASGNTGDGNGEEADEEDCGTSEAGETTEPEPEGPESGTDNSESDSQTPEEPKEPEEPERHETEEQDQTDVDESDDEAEDSSDQEEEENDDEDDDDEEEQKEASISVYTDPWDNTGWGIEPVLKHLKQTFGDKLEITYELGPVRTFDDSDLQTKLWQENSKRHGMPTDESVWENGGPPSTELSIRAFAAAKEQDEQKARDYLRRLRIAAQVEGNNIEDQNLLLRLAEEVGLTSNQLQMDWGDIETDEAASVSETPILDVTIDDVSRTWEGHVEYERALAAFLGHAMEPEPVFQSVRGFVEEHGPVATEEVAEVFELTCDEAKGRLRSNDDVRSEEFDCGTLWKI